MIYILYKSKFYILYTNLDLYIKYISYILYKSKCMLSCSLSGQSLSVIPFPSSRYQPVQQQQWRLLPALSPHLPDHQVLHVHGGLQPEDGTAVLRG